MKAYDASKSILILKKKSSARITGAVLVITGTHTASRVDAT